MRKTLLIVAAIMGTVALTGCQGKKNKGAEAAEDVVYVKVEPARAEKVAQTIDFTANLEAYQMNFIVPSLAARIEQINVEVGDKVKKGQILVELDKTQLNTNKLQLSNAELNLARMMPVYETGGISKQQIDEMETNIGVLKETVKNLEDNLTLRSPINGVVTGRYNEVGDLFSMSMNSDGGIGILQVMQMDKLKAYVYVSEQYFPQVYMGMPVKVVAETFPDRTFEGKVSRIAPAINPSTRTFEVEVTVPNSDLTLRPGMYARTTFNMGEVNGITVQDMAVMRQTGTNDKYVYVVNDEGIVDKHFVTVGRRMNDRIEIISGVEIGENVVIAGGNKITTGMKVEIEK